MSIHLAAVEEVTPGTLTCLAVISVVALSILRVVGFFSPREPSSLQRLTPAKPVGPLMMNAGIAVLVFIGTSIVVGLVLRGFNPGASQQAIKEGISPKLMILLSCALPAASLLWMFFGLKKLVPDGYQQIGLDEPPQPLNALTALGVLVAALPAIMLAGNVAEWLYQRFGYQHESAHELLQSMSDVGSGWQRIAAVFAAVILAPLNEEILFRGHLQSGIRRLLMPHPGVILAEAAAVAVDPSLMPPPLPEVTVDSTIPPAILSPTKRSFLASAVAVTITSAIFTSIHPMWSWPPIFLLSLFLGICYERKGNLWTPIFLHALFNGAMITAYLSMQPQGH